MTYPIHPAAELFPLMEGPDFDALVEDIRRRGQDQAAVMLDGAVLDGRNRLRACEKLGIKPLMVDAPKDARKDPVGYVLGANLHRRHLDKEAREHLHQRLREQGLTVQQIAAKTATPKSTVHRDVKAVIPNGKTDSPHVVIGKDGKQYPSRKRRRPAAPTSQEHVIQAADEFAEVGERDESAPTIAQAAPLATPVSTTSAPKPAVPDAAVCEQLKQQLSAISRTIYSMIAIAVGSVPRKLDKALKDVQSASVELSLAGSTLRRQAEKRQRQADAGEVQP